MNRTPIGIAFFVCLSIAFSARAGGIYRYVEPDGVIVYTNVRPGGANASKARRVDSDFRRAPNSRSALPNISSGASKLDEFDQHIEEAAKRYKLPPNLVRAVMHVESAFNPMAVSSAGASGLMQLMPGTAQMMYVKDIFDVRENINGGARYLRTLANMFNGDMVKIIAAYNAGPEAVRKYGGNIPPYAETQDYVKKVLHLYFQYKAQSQLAQRDP